MRERNYEQPPLDAVMLCMVHPQAQDVRHFDIDQEQGPTLMLLPKSSLYVDRLEVVSVVCSILSPRCSALRPFVKYMFVTKICHLVAQGNWLPPGITCAKMHGYPGR